MSEPGMVIVGSGKAAARAVVGLREFGWKGPITLIGEEKHLPYDLPPLSKAAITAAGRSSTSRSGRSSQAMPPGPIT